MSFLTKTTAGALACYCLLTISASTRAAIFEIESATGLFAPSFRSAANTTWFGWGSGSFDGATNNELIDNPATTIGGAVGAALNQNGTADILSSSNNIYTAGNALDLTVTAPTAGTPGTGFTTIIVQGKTLFGGFNTDIFLGEIAGQSATTVQANNAMAAGQFWAKYEIPGNLASYSLDISALSGHNSIGEIVVDTYWSATSFAPDVATVPEPGSLSIASVGFLAFIWHRRRSRQTAAIG